MALITIGMGDCMELQIAKDRVMCQLCMFMLNLSSAFSNLSKRGIFDVVKL